MYPGGAEISSAIMSSVSLTNGKIIKSLELACWIKVQGVNNYCESVSKVVNKFVRVVASIEQV